MCYTELKVKQKINVWHLIFQAMTHCYQDTSPLHVSWTNFTIIGNIKISWSNIRITASTKFLTLERTFRTAVIAYLSDDFSEKISPGSSESVKKQALKRVPIVSWLPQYNTLVSRLSHHPSHHHCHHHSHNFPEIVKVLILLITWHHWGCLSHKLVGSTGSGRCWFVYQIHLPTIDTLVTGMGGDAGAGWLEVKLKTWEDILYITWYPIDI